MQKSWTGAPTFPIPTHIREHINHTVGLHIKLELCPIKILNIYLGNIEVFNVVLGAS